MPTRAVTAKVSEEPRTAEPSGGPEIEEWLESLDDVLRRHGAEEAARRDRLIAVYVGGNGRGRP